MTVISVLLPVRNAAATLAEAIESVLLDRDEALELVVVDDRSTDGSAAIAARFAARDRRVLCVSAEPAAGEGEHDGEGGVGVARALTCGLAVARGEFIGRMDADDVSLADRFPRERRLLEEDPRLGAVGVKVEAFGAARVGEGLAAYLAWQNSLVSSRQHADAMFVESPLCHPSVLVRRAALDAVGGWRDGPFAEDYDLWLRLDAAGFALAKVDATLFRWRHREERMTFRDPRCSAAAMLALRARGLAARLSRQKSEFVIWGAGRTGRRLARALEAYEVLPRAFVDIDPRKLGRQARGLTIEAPEAVLASRLPFVVVAVGARGARDIVRSRLIARGRTEGVDFLCAA